MSGSDVAHPKKAQDVQNPGLVTAPDAPLTEGHYRELALANRRAKTIRTAAGVAAFNGWGTSAFAALSAPFAFSSFAGLFITVGLAVIAYNEFRGRKRLLRFDPSAASLLGWNQTALLAIIVVYCLWMLLASLAGAVPLAAELQASPELAEAIGSLDGFEALYKTLVVALYGTVMLLSAIFQGLNSLYYFTLL